jgi:S-DNA-T family DNA segregation ATPase FtsK/SpoIIIE
VRTGGPGLLVLEFVRRDGLAASSPPCPSPTIPICGALPVGRREDGTPCTIRLRGTHLLIAGATGAGGKTLGHLGPDPRPAPAFRQA